MIPRTVNLVCFVLFIVLRIPTFPFPSGCTMVSNFVADSSSLSRLTMLIFHILSDSEYSCSIRTAWPGHFCVTIPVGYFHKAFKILTELGCLSMCLMLRVHEQRSHDSSICNPRNLDTRNVSGELVKYLAQSRLDECVYSQPHFVPRRFASHGSNVGSAVSFRPGQIGIISWNYSRTQDPPTG